MLTYSEHERGFLESYFDSFVDGDYAGTVPLVYADYLEDYDYPEAALVRALTRLDENRKNAKLLKEVHAMNHRLLSEEIVGYESGKVVYPLSVIVNGWKSCSIAYFPPVNKDRRAVSFTTKQTHPIRANGAVVIHPGYTPLAAKTWTEIYRNEIVDGEFAPPVYNYEEYNHYGKVVDGNTVPGEVKKAMLFGYLNHVRKQSEKLCGFGPPRLKKKEATNET